MLDGLDDDETPSVGSIKKLLDGHISKLRDELASQVEKTVGEKLNPVTEHMSEQKAQRYWAEWEKEHPDVADKRDDLLDQAQEFVDEKYPNLGDKEYTVAVQSVFDRLVHEEE